MISATLFQASFLLLSVQSRATVIGSSNFQMTAEGYASAGSTATVSTSFKTYSNFGDSIGAASDGTLDNGSGRAYALFFPEGVALLSVSPSGGTLTSNKNTDPVTLTIPPQAFSSTVIVTIQTPNSSPACSLPPGQTFINTGVDVEILISSGIEPTSNVEISISYAGASLPSGINKSTLFIARCDLSVGVWLPLISNSDIQNSLVTAETDRFSFFEILGASLPGTVKDVAISDNPIMPSRGVPSATFSNLPVNARLRIYTISGLLVKDITTDASGMATWNATNQSDRQVASGTYFVFAQGAGTTKTFKIAVQR